MLEEEANKLESKGEMVRLQNQTRDISKLLYYWRQKFAKEEERKKKWIYLSNLLAETEMGLADSELNLLQEFCDGKLAPKAGAKAGPSLAQVAEAPWGPVAERAVAPRFDNPRATVLVLVLG